MTQFSKSWHNMQYVWNIPGQRCTLPKICHRTVCEILQLLSVSLEPRDTLFPLSSANRKDTCSAVEWMMCDEENTKESTTWSCNEQYMSQSKMMKITYQTFWLCRLKPYQAANQSLLDHLLEEKQKVKKIRYCQHQLRLSWNRSKASPINLNITRMA